MTIRTAPPARRWAARCSLGALMMAAAASAAAQAPAAAVSVPAGEDAVDGIADIVVTAERRSNSVQKTPIAITALGGDTLRDSGVSTIEGLSQSVPNVTFARNAGDAKIFIRGVGYNSISPGGETRVALYLDGLYQSRTQAGLMGFYDVDRVEVLRGPQGTLYGRNAIAGTINIITRDPGNSVNGYVTGTVGDYGLIGTEGAIGGPLGEGVEGRISFRTVDREGYGKNLNTGEDVNDEHSRSVRAKLAFQPADTIRVKLIADYANRDDHSAGYYYVGPVGGGIIPLANQRGGRVPTDKQDYAGNGPKYDMETYSLGMQADIDLGDRSVLTLLSGYRKLDAKLNDSLDGTTLLITNHFITESSKTFSQEVRLAQNFGDFADLIVGGYYFHETNRALNEAAFAGLVIGGAIPNQLYEFFGTFGRVKTNAYAVFAQANINLTDRLKLDVGGRYSDETKKVFEQFQVDRVNPFVQGNPLNPLASLNQKASANSFDPKITLSYQATRDIYVYATYSRGFKSGGFNIGGLQPPFRPEKLTNYEAGFKADLLDRRLRINMSAFNYQYKQLQVSLVVGTTLQTRNAASARVRGLEAEITALPVDDLRLTFNAGYLDAKFRDFTSVNPSFPTENPDRSGNRLPNAPRYQLDGTIGYTFHTAIGDITPRANLTWTDKIFFTQFNTPQLSQSSRTQVNLFLNWDLPGSGWSASAYVKNLTDDTYILDAVSSSPLLGSPVLGQYGPPRTIGLSVTKAF